MDWKLFLAPQDVVDIPGTAHLLRFVGMFYAKLWKWDFCSLTYAT